MGRPAARVTDPVTHPLPGVLNVGPGSPNVLIGNLPAWRGVPAGAAAAVQAARKVSDAAIKVAEAATLAASGTPGAPAAKAAEEVVKSAAAVAMGSMITGSAGGADIHTCATPLPIPPHGPGVVIDGSKTVTINGLPACRQGDTIIEALGPPDKIALGLFTVLIGDSAGGGASSPAPGADDEGGSHPHSGGAGGGGGPASSQSGGGAKPAPTPEQNVQAAIAAIKASDFGKTPEGQKVVAKIEALDKAGKIKFGSGPGTRGEWTGSEIKIGDDYKNDPEAIGSELVHEATHAVNEDELPASKKKATIDEEVRTNSNQLDYYEEQRKRGYRDPDLEERRNDRANGKLRDNVKKRYPKLPEHL